MQKAVFGTASERSMVRAFAQRFPCRPCGYIWQTPRWEIVELKGRVRIDSRRMAASVLTGTCASMDPHRDEQGSLFGPWENGDLCCGVKGKAWYSPDCQVPYTISLEAIHTQRGSSIAKSRDNRAIGELIGAKYTFQVVRNFSCT
jgi:hypothetical protein